ncbi:MAG: ATPase, partial [Mesorhizobium sp.]
KVTLKTPSGSLSTAEAIATMISGLSQAAWFDGGKLHAEGLAPSLVGAIVKDPVQDKVVLEEYLETVLKKRPDYAGYYAALNAAI